MTKSVKSSKKRALSISIFSKPSSGFWKKELNTEAVAAEQGHHSIGNTQRYDARMEAVNFSLNHDDGVSDKNLKEADVILMGVSRSGKNADLSLPCTTIRYPRRQLPADSRRFGIHRPAAHGQTLQRQAVRPDHSTRTPAGHPSRAPSELTYAKIDTCRSEIADAQNMFKRHGIPFTNTTDKSVEELAVHILQACKLKRRF